MGVYTHFRYSSEYDHKDFSIRDPSFRYKLRPWKIGKLSNGSNLDCGGGFDQSGSFVGAMKH